MVPTERESTSGKFLSNVTIDVRNEISMGKDKGEKDVPKSFGHKFHLLI